MSPIHRDDWDNENEFFCARCLTSLERRTVRCYRCDASFEGAGRYNLLSGRSHAASLLNHDHS